MNKNLLIGLGVLVLPAVVMGSYMLMTKNSNISTDILDQVTSQKTGDISEKSLTELLVVKEAQKCTVEHVTNMTKSAGVVYVADGKIRGDYDVVAGGQASKIHFIIDTKYIHAWIDAVPMGFKISMTAAQNYSQSPNSQVPDINQKLAYTCESWVVDTAMFALPTNLTFTSI